MNPALFSVSPLILHSGRKNKVTLHAKHVHSRKVLDKTAQIRGYAVHTPLDPRAPWPGKWANNLPLPFTRAANGDLEMEIDCGAEDEYILELEEKTGAEGAFRTIQDFRLYALDDDLFALRPFKGDFHMHSMNSDGRESAAYVAASCRKIGFDFMALTDHGRYAPSLEAIREMKQFDTGLKCCPGEEVHLNGNPPHIINFGGSFSVNDLANGNPELFERESAEIAKTLPEGIDKLTREQVSKSEWTFRQIQKGGGIAMFCHPYWRIPYHNFIGSAVINLLMERRKFDVLELFGGYCRGQEESNMLAFLHYQEELKRGNVIPVAGISDAHGCDRDLFGWYYTIILAKSPEFPDLAEGIRANRSVAVHNIPGTFPLLAGSFRITRYAYFLLREFFPEHDELCRIEGELLIRALADEDRAGACAELTRRNGKVSALWKNLWAK